MYVGALITAVLTEPRAAASAQSEANQTPSYPEQKTSEGNSSEWEWEWEWGRDWEWEWEWEQQPEHWNHGLFGETLLGKITRTPVKSDSVSQDVLIHTGTEIKMIINYCCVFTATYH